MTHGNHLVHVLQNWENMLPEVLGSQRDFYDSISDTEKDIYIKPTASRWT